MSEVSSEKEGHLRSQQEISELRDEVPSKRIMKKTNSEYRFNPDREEGTRSKGFSSVKRGKIYTHSSSPHGGTEQSEADTFVEWAVNWAEWEGLEAVSIDNMGDGHLLRQWMTFMHNRFKVA